MIVVNLYTKTLHFTGILCLSISLQASENGNFGENLPKVSNPDRRNSRFLETSSGDFFELH